MKITDPDRVQEVLCLGQHNVAIQGPLAILTFTQTQCAVEPMFHRGEIKEEAVVRARIAVTIQTLADLKATIEHVLEQHREYLEAPRN